jgi:hypothetical protein
MSSSCQGYCGIGAVLYLGFCIFFCIFALIHACILYPCHYHRLVTRFEKESESCLGKVVDIQSYRNRGAEDGASRLVYTIEYDYEVNVYQVCVEEQLGKRKQSQRQRLAQTGLVAGTMWCQGETLSLRLIPRNPDCVLVVNGSVVDLPRKPFEVALLYGIFFLFECGVGMFGYAGYPWQTWLASVPLFVLGGCSLSQALCADTWHSFYHEATSLSSNLLLI